MLADRFHALDAVRAGALLLGIVLHACMSFFIPIPVLDNSQSATLGVLFYVIHIFRMSLFFMLAGFFAHMSFYRKGAKEFARERFKRIVLPMLFGWLVISPLLAVIIVWGAVRTWGVDISELPPPPDMGLALTHLWFLYYLCLIYLCFLSLRWLFVKTLGKNPAIAAGIDAVVKKLVNSVAGPVVLGLPLALVLYSTPLWAPWFGLPTPDYGLDPKPPAMTGYGVAFTLGWWLHRQTGLLHALPSKAFSCLLIAVLLTAVCLSLVGIAPTVEEPFAASPVWHKPLYTLCYTTATWFWVFGILAAALRFMKTESPRWRYLADASYWMYIAHLPIVFTLQVLVAQWPLHWLVKFPLILAVTVAVLLLSYQWLVRPTRLGVWLGGKPKPRFA